MLRAKAARGAGIVAGAALALLSVYACLPDLVEPPAATPVGVRPVACGDGFIDPAAGEECDPGDTDDAGVAGCTRDCKAVCEGAVVPASQGAKTGHCYFALDTPLVFDDATRACAARAAHLVTVSSSSELASPPLAFATAGADAGEAGRTYWIGLTQLTPDTGLQRYLAVATEPGFAPPARCPGCYGNVGAMMSPSATFPKLNATDTGATCVVARSPSVGGEPWYRVPCTEPRDVVCEREPVGTRSYACNGGICVTLALTERSKRYLYVPAPSGPHEAARACAQLSNGNGHLVVYGSNGEREELFRELGLARVLEANRDFWIGLAFDVDASTATDAAVWAWDGVSTRPIDLRPWAEGEPQSTMPVRAFSRASGTYDTELAHADSATAQYPYVCEYDP